MIKSFPMLYINKEFTICDAAAWRRTFETNRFFGANRIICGPMGIRNRVVILNTTLHTLRLPGDVKAWCELRGVI
jgi:hypothetical protein